MTKTTKRIRKRTRGRELALQYLYQWDLLRVAGCAEAGAFLAEQESDEEAREFALELIHGVIEHQPAIDLMIDKIARNWTLKRMLVVDRTILRAASFELMFCQDTIPSRVAINEAIELAKKYSTEKSSAFVNGILDRVPRMLADEAAGVNSDDGAAKPAATEAKASEPQASAKGVDDDGALATSNAAAAANGKPSPGASSALDQ